MADFHFVEDYEKLVDGLLKNYSIDQAMEMAVGGHYELFGSIEVSILRHAGLRSGNAVLDVGCGSGRLAHALSKSDLQIRYTGIDIIQSMLDYAARRTPCDYTYILNRALSLPVGDGSQDVICGFSLFTHLLHHESYIYMEDAARALRPGGKLVFSFLEFAAESHWATFLVTIEQSRTRTSPHLNMFIERDVVRIWAGRLGLEVEYFIDGNYSVDGQNALGQTTAVLRRA